MYLAASGFLSGFGNWAIAVLIAVVMLGWYLTYSAARLDRLHTRLEGTYAALDAQLVRRAEAVLELANSGRLDGATSLILIGAAAEALSMSDEPSVDREQVESDLTETLNVALAGESAEAVREDPCEEFDRLAAAAKRVQLARRFHNDAVTDVRLVRRKFLVRTFRLAGHTDLPRTVEFADEAPWL